MILLSSNIDYCNHRCHHSYIIRHLPMSMRYPSSGPPAETFTPTAYQTHQTTGPTVQSPSASHQLQMQQMLLDQQAKSLKKKEKKVLKQELKQKTAKYQAYPKQCEQHSVQMYENVKKQQVLQSDQHHVHQTVAPQDSFVECETSREVTDTESTEESQEITKYDTPMQMVKQQKSKVSESMRVKYVENTKNKNYTACAFTGI